MLGRSPRANACINDTRWRVENIVSCGVSQVIPLGQRPDEMQHVSGMVSTPVGGQPGLISSFSATPDEADDYADYVGGGGSPLGISSESSNQDRSCTSTPIGNDGSPAGEFSPRSNR